MLTVKEINTCNNLHKIPKSIHINKGVCFDSRLLHALDAPDERDYKYDFDVYLPTYGINLQRPYVWEHCQQNEFILSILLEKPIDPVIIVQHINDVNRRDVNTVNYVIDGKQRLMTIQKFVHNEFPIIVNHKEYYWRDFDEEAQMFFKSRVNYLTGTVYYSYEDTPVTDDMKIILFNFYNFAGTPQTEEHKRRLQAFYNMGRYENIDLEH